MRRLEPFRYSGTEPLAINNKGQVVGESAGSGFVWQDGKTTDLPPLPDWEASGASAINDSGLVVGESYNGIHGKKPGWRACLWDQKGEVTDLGSLGGDSSEAQAINSKGQVVGTSDLVGADPASSTAHAFLWQDGKMVDLNSLIPAGSGWVLREACGINAADQIVGDGDFKGRTRAFLLTPIK